jgi:outer membrane protein TolC
MLAARRRNSWYLLPSACLCALAAACVGPNFERPPPPQATRYASRELPAETASSEGAGGAAQRFLSDADVPRNWWTQFGSEELNGLVTQALRANPQIRSAQAALRQAMENTAAQRGSYLPQVQGSFDATRNRDPTGVLQPNLASGTPVYNLFTPQVTAPTAARWSPSLRKPRRSAFTWMPPI